MKSYAEVDEFSSYYLEDSYVLGIVATPGHLAIELDVVLTPSHPEYSEDHPGEQHCYRRGRLAFSGVTCLLWEDQGLPSAEDATGEMDYGGIDSWSVQDGNRHVLVGDFGRISIISNRAELSLKGGVE
jgi:hypothetical protein